MAHSPPDGPAFIFLPWRFVNRCNFSDADKTEDFNCTPGLIRTVCVLIPTIRRWSRTIPNSQSGVIYQNIEMFRLLIPLIKFVVPTRFERVTFKLWVYCSANWAKEPFAGTFPAVNCVLTILHSVTYNSFHLRLTRVFFVLQHSPRWAKHVRDVSLSKGFNELFNTIFWNYFKLLCPIPVWNYTPSQTPIKSLWYGWLGCLIPYIVL